MPTTSLGFALAFFVAAFVSTLVGLAFRAYLADRLGLDHARDMVGGVTGLVVTLVALVFGLLIWTAFGVAFGVFSTQKTELQVMAANALEFNQETRECGPEAAHALGIATVASRLAVEDIAARDIQGDLRCANLARTHIRNVAADQQARSNWDAKNYLNESLTLEIKAAGTRLSGTWMVWLRPSFWRVMR